MPGFYKTSVFLLQALILSIPSIILAQQPPESIQNNNVTVTVQPIVPEIVPPLNLNATTFLLPNSNVTTTPSPIIRQSTTTAAITQQPISKETTTTPPTKTTSTPVTSTPLPYPPQPVFPNGIGTWVADSNDSKCIIIKGAFLLIAKIDGKNNTKISETIEVPILADAVGNCSSTSSQSISLIWYVPSSDKTKTLENTLYLEFKTSMAKEYSEELGKSSSTEHYHLSYVNFTFSPQQFLDHKENAPDMSIANETNRFQTPLDKSYSCIHEESVTFLDANNKYLGQLSMANVQLQSFRTDSNENFSPGQKCKADRDAETSRKVLIGVAIAVPVALVICGIICFYWFWRSRRTAYTSLDGY